MSTSTDPRFNIFESPGKELFAGMLDKEKNFVAPAGYVHNKEIIALRRTAVVTVESLCSNCSDALIPYLAMTYFDRYLSCCGASIPDRKNLFVICCVTLAWKLRNSSFKRSTFLEEKGLLEQEEKGLLEQYRIQDVDDMELLIREGLNRRMRILTAFSFIKFYIPYLRSPRNTLAPLRHVYQLIIRSQCDIAFAEIRPSVLAASAIIFVSSKRLPYQHYLYELMIGTDIEHLRPQMNMVLKCCELLRPFYRNPPICKPRDIPISPPAEVPISPPAEAEDSSFQVTRTPPIPIPDDILDQDDHIDDGVLMDFELGWDEWLKDCEVRDGQLPRVNTVRLVPSGYQGETNFKLLEDEPSNQIRAQADSIRIVVRRPICPTFKESFFNNMEWNPMQEHMKNIKACRVQGDLDSCSAIAVADCVHGTYVLEHRRQTPLPPPLAPLEIYKHAGCLGNVKDSTGFSMSGNKHNFLAIFEYVKRFGICPEMDLPYITDNFTESNAPPPQTGMRFCIEDYGLLSSKLTAPQLKHWLKQGPVVLSLRDDDEFHFYDPKKCTEGVYKGLSKKKRKSFDDSENKSEHHAVLLGYGYLPDGKTCYLGKNSWGPDWGFKGYFKVAEEYVLNSDKAICWGTSMTIDGQTQ